MPCSFCRVLRLFSAVCATALVVLLCATTLSYASSLGVSPTLIDLSTGESVAGLRIRNGDAGRSVTVQTRVVRWRQDATGDVYAPADGVLASPPVTRVAPGTENLIRIVRTAAHPVASEESYRLLVDELPDPGGQQPGMISMLIRHSVPVFFSHTNAASAQPQWRITQVADAQAKHSRWLVTVVNHGDKRMRLADLALLDANGKQIAERAGLVGYVLGHASRGFMVTADAPMATQPPALRISVQTETGSLQTELLPVISP